MEKIKKNHFVFLLVIGILTTISLSQIDTIYAASAPEPISDLIASPSNGKVELTWTAPIDNGATISSYRVIMWQTGSDVFTTFPNLSTQTFATVTQLTNGISYSFKVIAVNSIGSSPDSNIVTVIPTTTPSLSVPEPITDLKATREDRKVKLTWTAPFDNGSPITAYEISYWQIGFQVIKTKTVTSTNAQITDLTNDVPYSFTVTAINSVGHGPDSNIVSATPSASVSASVPNQVRGVVANPSDGQVFLSWIQPSANGSPITSYRVVVSEMGSNVFTTYPILGTATKVTIPGLQNGITYTFSVSAVNAVGVGKGSQTIASTPNSNLFIEILNLKAQPGDKQVTLTWSVSSATLDQVTGYRVREYTPTSTSFITHPFLGKATKATIGGLKNGSVYGFSVIAVTSQGLGPESQIVYASPFTASTTPGVPKAIKDLKASTGDGQVTLSWTKPDDGGYPIIGYNIIRSQSGSASYTTFPKSITGSSTTVTGLTNGVSYDFKIQAINSKGLGPESNLITATPKTPGTTLQIPSWIKNNAKWWAEGRISDIEYVKAIEYLINQGIIRIK
jgi:hypothetical protein